MSDSDRDAPAEEHRHVLWGHRLFYYGRLRSKQKHQHQFSDDMRTFIASIAKRFPIARVAEDVVGAGLLGFSAQAARHLWEAGRLGLVETDTRT